MSRQRVECLTVDVGRNTAWASWVLSKMGGTVILRNTGCWTCQEPMGEKFLAEQDHHMLFLLDDLQPKRIIIEGVEYWETSEKSRIAARQNDLVWLAYTVGIFTSRAFEVRGAKVEIIPAPYWKGQLTKEATQARVHRIIGGAFPNEHVYDAVAMGLALLTPHWGLHD